MKFRPVYSPPLEAKTDLLAIAVHAEPLDDALAKAASKALGGVLAQQAADEEFVGKPGQTVVVATRGDLPARYIALIGAGDKSGFELGKVRDLGARAGRLGQRLSARNVTLVLPPVGARQLERAVELAVEGALLGTYRYERYKGAKSRKPGRVEQFQIGTDRRAGGSAKQPPAAKQRALKAAVERAEVVCRSVCHTRDLVNGPPELVTPEFLAKEARSLARKHGLQAKVLGPAECEKLGMGMLLAVGRGSENPIRLIHLIYKPKGKPKKRVALVGKGITFDSGGYSIKPSSGMEDMKMDMAGAATVIAAMGALRDLGCKHEVHAVAPCAENLVSGRAYKLGDVLKAMDGTNVEINNTDAEGRLALGDAFGYVRAKIAPDEMFDFATLTGACVVALGPYTSAVLSDHENLAREWLAASESAAESMWRLPLTSRLKEQLKSNIADMRNTGERWGGTITAGLFLKHFAKDTPWVHNDIAGPASVGRESPAVPKGGTGFGIATILEYLTR